MTRKEAERITRQQNVLMSLGFTQDETERLRRISMTLHRWHERECGDGNGCIERDEETGKTYWRSANTDRRWSIPDRENGAIKRLQKIMQRVNLYERHGDLPDGSDADKAGALGYYIQTDPRGAALYIMRPRDLLDGSSVESCYSRGVCVY
jgi:hypothetical protein